MEVDINENLVPFYFYLTALAVYLVDTGVLGAFGTKFQMVSCKLL